MPTFPAPTPVPVVVDLPVGAGLHVVAGDRDDVVVTVLPADPAKASDVRTAEEVRVGRDDHAVTITGPRAWKQYVPFAAGSIAVTVELPAGSDLSGRTGTLYAEGRLGAVDVQVSAGDARVDEAGRLDLKVSAGSVVVGRITGAASVKASAGSVRIAELAGDGSVRASNGPTVVGSVTGSLQVTGAHAEISVGRVRGTLTATTASAGIRVESVEHGTATLTTSYGTIEVGVPEGTAAWLDVSSEHGTARNQLIPTDGPADDQPTAEIHASTSYGDVIVRRP
ncbi:DUF4097 family beta strand repeat-containing protein [Cellulomonas cellasea]|uniref:DUF4097 domain-containing protein n=2 Tax=Cellulomonas cellasea TaxID=43670 RepID=A0A0A0BAF7_9CELL|nr:DUF4097 family beta strand repeat-containing protein [Cellulomonas cellasea]KGM02276.1 hypothetical protein Q760_14390 [Cellulomonas cellasea DSM 20118]GEA86194.1 hypothetical protein CCE01nite_01430 [Cellulomonas cellasea]